MIAVHTQESLNSLTWDEVRSLHASLGLVATATSRTRRDYERRILQVQPQKVEEPIAQTTDDQPPGRCDGRGRVEPENWFADIFTPKESETQQLRGKLDILIEQELQAQLAIERTVKGSEEEKKGYEKLRAIEVKIAAIENRIDRLLTPVPLPRIWEKVTSDVAIGDYIKMPFHPVWMVADKESMKDGRTRLLVKPSTGSHSEEWYLPAPQPVQPAWSLDEIEEAIAQLKTDINLGKLKNRPVRATESNVETISWKTPFQGEILGREGRQHSFFVEHESIHLVIQSEEKVFCASENRHKNYHIVVIRQAIEAGKTFDPLSNVGEACRFGRIHQSCDGWWWVWLDGQATGHKFLTKLMALKHLELRNAELGDLVGSVAGVAE